MSGSTGVVMVVVRDVPTAGVSMSNLLTPLPAWDTVTAPLKLVIANVGDCQVVLSDGGVRRRSLLLASHSLFTNVCLTDCYRTDTSSQTDHSV
jgi:serine/threonine protein phosphatase PrpC